MRKTTESHVVLDFSREEFTELLRQRLPEYFPRQRDHELEMITWGPDSDVRLVFKLEETDPPREPISVTLNVMSREGAQWLYPVTFKEVDEELQRMGWSGVVPVSPDWSTGRTGTYHVPTTNHGTIVVVVQGLPAMVEPRATFPGGVDAVVTITASGEPFSVTWADVWEALVARGFKADLAKPSLWKNFTTPGVYAVSTTRGTVKVIVRRQGDGA